MNTPMMKIKAATTCNSIHIEPSKTTLNNLESLTLTLHQKNFDSQIQLAEKLMKKHHNTLHKLAK